MNRPKTADRGTTPPDESMGDILDFMQRLWALDHQLQSLSKRMRRRFGTTGPQRLVLRLVGKFPGISAGGLSRRLHVHPSTLTGVFRRLESEGFLKREQDRQDARRLRFTLTAKGERINGLRRGTVEDAIRRSLRKIPARERLVTRKVLDMLARDLSAEI